MGEEEFENESMKVWQWVNEDDVKRSAKKIERESGKHVDDHYRGECGMIWIEVD